jgi:hypothetical protein
LYGRVVRIAFGLDLQPHRKHNNSRSSLGLVQQPGRSCKSPKSNANASHSYTRVEVTALHRQRKLHQFTCSVCGRILEAGVTSSLIGYRMSVQPDVPMLGRRQFPLI